jgi:hypothetical protein
VARGLSLVSAAESSDAGFGFAELLEPQPLDAGLDAADAAVEKPFDFAHGNPGRRPPPPPAPVAPRQGGHGSEPDDEDKGEKDAKDEATSQQHQVADAGRGGGSEHH